MSSNISNNSIQSFAGPMTKPAFSYASNKPPSSTGRDNLLNP